MSIERDVAVIAPGVADVDSAEAFRRLSEKHVQSAFRLAWAILGNEREAQDAVQDSFASAWGQRTTQW